MEMIFKDRDLFFFIIAALGAFATLLFSISMEDPSIYSAGLLSRFSTLLFSIVAIFFVLRKLWKISKNIHERKDLPVVVVTGKDKGDAKHLLQVAKEIIKERTGFEAFKEVEDTFNVNFEYLLIDRDKDLDHNDPDQWNDIIGRVQREINRFNQMIPGEKVYHIFIFGYGLTSLAISLGAVFGTRLKVIVYQFIQYDEWKPVLDITGDIRRLKEKITSYEYTSGSIPSKPKSEVALVLNMASKSITGYVKEYLKKNNIKDLSVVEVNNTYDGNLQVDDWTVPVQEMFNFFSQILEKAPRRIHLFHEMPTALAFGFGLALGIYSEVTVYGWDATNQTYHPLFSLNGLESAI